MRYGKKDYLVPGDTLKSTQETMNFHRDMTYKVSKCFQLDGNMIIFVENKYGKDVLFKPNNFEYTAKTGTSAEKRIKESRLTNFWRNHDSIYEVFNGWDRSDETNVIRNSTLYELTRNCHFCSYPNAIASIKKKIHKGESETIYIYNVEEFFNYFEKEITYDNWDYGFQIQNLPCSVQDSFDHMLFMTTQNYPIYDESLVNLSEYSNGYLQLEYKSFTQFKDLMGNLIFDTDKINKDQLEIISDIMVLFRDLPSSHSGTSISKILNGTSKVKINKLEPYVGKYKGVLKQPQLFELASHIESFLFKSKIFKTKEEYSSDKDGEWRGSFEYIGSKYIDNKELDKLLTNMK